MLSAGELKAGVNPRADGASFYLQRTFRNGAKFCGLRIAAVSVHANRWTWDVREGRVECHGDTCCRRRTGLFNANKGPESIALS